PLKVIEFDKEAKKIVLSVVESMKNKGNEAHEEYFRLHPVPQSGPAGSSAPEVAETAETETEEVDPNQSVSVEEFSAEENTSTEGNENTEA
ncbi:MAG: hypothetical protein ABI876_04785, partial [Bacteroidota bacterium]